MMSQDATDQILQQFEAHLEEDELLEARSLIDESIKAHPEAIELRSAKAELEIEEENYLEGIRIIDRVLIRTKANAARDEMLEQLVAAQEADSKDDHDDIALSEDTGGQEADVAGDLAREDASESEGDDVGGEEGDGAEEEPPQLDPLDLEDDTLSTMLNLRGYAAYYLGQFEESRRSFNQALRYDSENWSALVGRATTHDRLGFQVAALLDIEHAVDIDDQEAEPFALRGKVFMKRREFEQAARDFAYALESDPNDEESRLHLARLLARNGATADAMELLAPLLEYGENDNVVATGALLRSQLSMTLGSTDAASQDAQVAIDRWPEQPWGYLQMAACQLASMQAEETIKTLKTAERFVRNLRDVPDITALRASAYEQLEREDQARRERNKIEGSARLPAVVYGPILNPAQNVPINPDRPVDVRSILADLFGDPERAPKGYEEALREVVDRIPSIIADNPEVERIQIELPEAAGMRGGARNLVIQVNQQQRDAAAANQSAEA